MGTRSEASHRDDQDAAEPEEVDLPDVPGIDVVEGELLPRTEPAPPQQAPPGGA